MSNLPKGPSASKRPFRLIQGVSQLDDLADGYAAYGDLGMGNVYYVNGGSDGPTTDAGDGSKDYPKRTITAAMALCTSGNDDYIIVLNYGSNGRAGETWPIAVAKQQLHIIGVRATDASKWAAVKPSTAAAANAFTITGQRCEIANLEIGGYSTGSGVEVGNAVWGTYIHDCWFGVTGDTAGTHGVYVASGADAPYLTVTNCEFGASLTGDGVRIAGNATRGHIGKPGRGNIFREIAGVAVNVSGAAVLSGIFDNRFGLLADTVGDAITLGASTANIMVDGNRVGYGKTTAVTEYFVDGSSSNNWGQNWVGDAVALPA